MKLLYLYVLLVDLLVSSISIGISYLFVRAVALDRKFYSITLGFALLSIGSLMEGLIFSMVLVSLSSDSYSSPFYPKYGLIWLLSSILFLIGVAMIITYHMRSAVYSICFIILGKTLMDVMSSVLFAILAISSYKASKKSAVSYAILSSSQLILAVGYYFSNLNLVILSSTLKLIAFLVLLIVLGKA